MQKIKPNIYSVGAIDWDRRLFDQLIPLPDGTTYNAYLIKGSEKTALLDTVDPTKTKVLIDNLVKAGTEKIDYIVAHHAEQDHSGAMPDVLKLYPAAKVVTNPKCKSMLMDLLPVNEDKFITVDDNQTLSLGNKTLRFVYIPWVHWPETMATYLVEDKILFPCDFFGSHLATSDLYAGATPAAYEAAKRYYAEIMMPFRTPIKNNLEKIRPLEIETIATSHGPIYDNPQLIIKAYTEWASDEVKNEVVLPYVSMHGSTKKIVEYFIDALIERNVTVKPFDLASVDIGKLAMALVDAATAVFACPTVLVSAHPLAAYAAVLTNELRPKTKFASIITSFGWASRAVEHLTSLMPNLKVQMIEPVVVKGLPKDNDFVALEKLADKILAKHRELKIAD